MNVQSSSSADIPPLGCVGEVEVPVTEWRSHSLSERSKLQYVCSLNFFKGQTYFGILQFPEIGLIKAKGTFGCDNRLYNVTKDKFFDVTVS